MRPQHSALGGKFPTTRLSALLGLGQPAPQRQRAWDALLASYWKPAYKHLRLNLRHGREDAEDLVQAFFARAFEKEFFAGYDPTRARFRTFLRMCLDRFVANEAKAQGRLKRGGGSTTVALDFDDAEQELARADLRAAAPDEIFDREWRRMLFALAIESLRAHCDATGRQTCFVVFERYDLCGPDERPTYPALADELGIPVTTVTNRLAYARRELRRCVRERLAEITADDEELEAETKVLFGRR